MFCSIELAARIESSEVELLRAAVEVARARGVEDVLGHDLGGGIAVWVEAGSPLCKVAGLGFAGAFDVTALEPVEAHFFRHGAPVQVELSSLGDPAIGTGLCDRGYRLVGFENVLGRPLQVFAPAAVQGEVDVRESPAAELDRWLELSIAGFATPDDRGIASRDVFPRDVLQRAMTDLVRCDGMKRYIAAVDGTDAGAGAMRLSAQSIAQMCGAATVPEFRRRGVQNALLHRRLADAAAARCDLATVTTQPGSTSQQNVGRHGFELLYVRAIFTREPG